MSYLVLINLLCANPPKEVIRREFELFEPNVFTYPCSKMETYLLVFG